MRAMPLQPWPSPTVQVARALVLLRLAMLLEPPQQKPTAPGGFPLPPCLAEGAVHMVDGRHNLLRLGQRGR